MIGGRVLDTSALVDFASGKSVYTQALVWVAVEQGIVLAVPAAALMAAWAALPPSDPDPLDVLLGLPVTVVDPLDEVSAREAAKLAAAGVSDPYGCIAAGHVAWSARNRGWPIVTSEPEVLRALGADLLLEPLP